MPHPRPFYYLENFCTALGWLRHRYADLLDCAELGFIGQLERLPRESAALLVRMLGRQGDVFRTGKLSYTEIGCPHAAATPLVELGWLDSQPLLSAAELGRLLRKIELQRALQSCITTPPRPIRKAELLSRIEAESLPARPLADWWADAPDCIYRVVVKPLCDRFRLLFFGNFRQDWSEFVLADLGILKYEQVARDPLTRPFQTRQHIDTFHAMFVCRQQLDAGGDLAPVLKLLPPPITDNEWLEGRRRKLQFQIAHSCERRQQLPQALAIYRNCRYAGARLRVVRLLERLGDLSEALQAAARVREQPADEVEMQQISRVWPRLQRKAGSKPAPVARAPRWPVFQLVLPLTDKPDYPEIATAQALSKLDAPVYYVENGLLSSLFGLLFWEAIFAPVAGAFFHEFQAAPADLLAPDFRERRAAQLSRCFEQLESDAYRDTIWRNFTLKQGIQSPFVFWGVVSEELLNLALSCFPSKHLQVCFARMLADIRANRCGLPDLVQFWPAERRYRLIEVKGPGDRLQDNQTRWLTFFASQAIPVSVCHVSW